MVDAGGGHGERTDGVLTGDEIVEVEFPCHACLIRQVIGTGQPAGCAARSPDRDARARAFGVVPLRDVQAAQVKAVVGVQMREHDSVNVLHVDVLLEYAESTVAEIQHETEAIVLDEVARRGRVRSGKRTGAADHREAHRSSLRGGARLAPMVQPADGSQLGQQVPASLREPGRPVSREPPGPRGHRGLASRGLNERSSASPAHGLEGAECHLGKGPMADRTRMQSIHRPGTSHGRDR